MARTLTIGLTGGIASGKSVVSSAFDQFGVEVIDADAVARDVVAPGTPGLDEIHAEFGADVFLADGQLDRRAMRRTIFADADARARLEAITHPRIRNSLAAARDQSDAPYCILVIPLLTKSQMRDLVDRVLVIDAPRSVQLERLQARDDIDDELAAQMIDAQDSRRARLALADDILINTGPRKDIADLAAAFHAGYLRLAHGELNELAPMHLPG
ncbi:dephospho-CoA kinase [Salinisphaera sp. USBA-960]|uniref:dephospho-CoA kinase n=1 Tax=Salinisphaera orenii TaxID=856731 RepID=UPI000DBE2AE9|nr:dephospho-CoA kinase [Salifodinibacter halophilus]NNC26550.1 dephospho-CoA kinase [Salifodinibacter halophilus]